MRISKTNPGRAQLLPSLLLIVLLTACASPQADATPTLSVDQIFTAAAQTLQAQQATQLALTPPTSTPSPSPSPTIALPSPVVTLSFASATPPSGGAVSSCDNSAYVADVTIPDGTVIKAGEKFTKTWKIYNSGTCNWTTGYKIAFASGDAMGGAATVLPVQVNSGSQADISVAMTAPTYNGTFKGNWRMQNASGTSFGNVVYVEIKVTNGTGTAPATASATEVTIAGNAGIGEATITYTGSGGSASGSVVADSAGAFSFKVAKGWSGTVVPSKGSWIFSPTSYSHNNLQADPASQNFTVSEAPTATP